MVEMSHAWERADELDVVVGERAIDTCLHLGWYAEPHDYLVNADANLRSLRSSTVLIDWLGHRQVGHLVVAGTSAEYGHGDQPHTEDECPAPWSVYGASKVALRYLLASSMRPTTMTVSWARLFNLTGPGEHPDRLLPWVVRSLRAGREVGLSPGHQLRDFLDVSDAAAALTALADARAHGTFNVSSGVGVPLRDVIGAIGERLGATDLLRFGERSYSEHDPPVAVGNNERLVAATGWAPSHSLESTVDRLLHDWERREDLTP